MSATETDWPLGFPLGGWSAGPDASPEPGPPAAADDWCWFPEKLGAAWGKMLSVSDDVGLTWKLYIGFSWHCRLKSVYAESGSGGQQRLWSNSYVTVYVLIVSCCRGLMFRIFISIIPLYYAASPTDLETWPLFAAVLVQWHQSWCSETLLQWQHQQSEHPSLSPRPPGLQVQINAGCLRPTPPGDCQTGTGSEYCCFLSPQACKVYKTHKITGLICRIRRGVSFQVIPALHEFVWNFRRYTSRKLKQEGIQWSSQCPVCIGQLLSILLYDSWSDLPW